MSDFGGMITIDMGSAARAEAVASGTRLFALAESLGGVESLISVPARMTHASVPEERRRDMGLTDSLVRLSVGIEDVEDLVADLDRALAAIGLIRWGAAGRAEPATRETVPRRLAYRKL